jgi:hypothetical protein
MTKELDISMTPDGYSLSSPVKKNGIIEHQQFLRGGTYSDLKYSLANLPKEFYKNEITINFNYHNESALIKVPEDKKEELIGIVRTLEESEKLFG